ncbi:hypothetical protein [Klebsiella quasipneumoniae]|uniref:hypothetical protein n=1 Tax=Klebsiella quasipneumoniae TaxID=1463165 RepID=UPI002DBD935A|nr:hypothetical protein [Klebsiella quasipneumoniae]MEB6595848.1 hypothetical protein [Klebsiella quasipneumoniae]
MIKVETMFQKGEVVSILGVCEGLKSMKYQRKRGGEYYYQDNDFAGIFYSKVQIDNRGRQAPPDRD